MRGSTFRWSGSPGGSLSTTVKPGTVEPGRETGFTLLEVLIAFAILAVVLVPILQVFGGGLGTTGTARAHATATLLARSKLAEIGMEDRLREGVTSGVFDEAGFRWRVTVERDLRPVIPPEDEIEAALERRRAAAGGTAGAGFGQSSAGGGRHSTFGQSSFGQSSFGKSSFGQSSFGKSSFGQSSFGQSSFGQSSFGKSSFGGGSLGKNSVGQSSFGQSFGSRSDTRQRQGGTGSAGSAAGADDSGVVDTGNELLPYRVIVTIEWGGAGNTGAGRGRGSGSLTLSSVRLARAYQPADEDGRP